jgi:phage tail sheath gpL-like
MKMVLRCESADGIVPVHASDKNQHLMQLMEWFRGLINGRPEGATTLDAAYSAVQATATVTCANVSAADTVTINGVVFTARAAAPGTDEWLQSGTDTEDAAALAAAINASTTAGALNVFLATSSGAVVTVKARLPGLSGNAIQVKSSNGTRLAVAGTATRDSLTYLSGGAESRVSYTY